MKGRPLWFLAIVIGGWAAARTAMLWPDAPPRALPGAAPMIVAAERALGRSPVAATTVAEPGSARTAIDRPMPRVDRPMPPAPVRQIAGVSALAQAVEVSAPAVSDPPRLVTPLVAPTRASVSRFSGSAWGIARAGSGGTPGAQLGGTQAGVRLRYALGASRRVAATVRVSTPARGTGREMAVGAEWRPAALPIQVIAEQRIALNGGKGGPSLLVAGGIGPTRVMGLSLEGYAQAGVIKRDRVEGFVDGAARLTRPLGAFDIGIGAWGGAQRGAERVDAGPTIGLRLPMARRVRVTLDWRARIAGRARPGSGPALSIGSDF